MIALWSLGYAASIAWVVWWVWRDLPRPLGATGRRAVAVAAVAFVVTWGFMLQMVIQDLARYPTFTAWLVESALFVQAYHEVTGTPEAWWWSSQLITWVVAAVLYLRDAGRQSGVRVAPYMWLGLAVAMSVALALFVWRVPRSSTASVTPDDSRAPWVLVLCVLLAFTTVFLVPTQGTAAMLPLLVVSHIAFIVPAWSRLDRARSPLSMSGLIVMVAVAAAMVHALATWTVLTKAGSATLQSLVATVVALPAQSSITADLILTVSICTALIAQRRGATTALAFVPIAALVSPAAAFAMFLLWPARRRATSISAGRTDPTPSPSPTR